MAKVNSVNLNRMSFGTNFNTKRQCVDNSEIYISSKLSRLYQQAVADCFVKSKIESIRNFTSKS